MLKTIALLIIALILGGAALTIGSPEEKKAQDGVEQKIDCEMTIRPGQPAEVTDAQC